MNGTKLGALQQSIDTQRDALTQQISDLQLRCNELTKQNGLLYQNLEAVTAQANSIKYSADGAVGLSEGDHRLVESDIRELAASFKKERDITTLQLEMSKSEVFRLKSQLEHVSKNLDDTRELLASVRAVLYLLYLISFTHLLHRKGTSTRSGHSNFRFAACRTSGENQPTEHTEGKQCDPPQ